MFKTISDLISVPLPNTFNKCIEMSYLPVLFSVTHVVPIFKSNDPLILNTYRPLPLLSVKYSKNICINIKVFISRMRKSYLSNNTPSSMGYRLIFL